MARALGMFGFGGGFLLISPQLRQALVDAVYSSFGFVQNYSPYSYVGLVLIAFGGVTVTLVTGSRPR